MKWHDTSKSTITTPTDTSSDEDQMMKDFLSIGTDEPQVTDQQGVVDATGSVQVLMPTPSHPTKNIFKHIEDTIKVHWTLAYI